MTAYKIYFIILFVRVMEMFTCREYHLLRTQLFPFSNRIFPLRDIFISKTRHRLVVETPLRFRYFLKFQTIANPRKLMRRLVRLV